MSDITNITWNNGLADIECDAQIGLGNTITVVDVNPAGYNGTYTVVAEAMGLVVLIEDDPGAYVSGGTLE